MTERFELFVKPLVTLEGLVLVVRQDDGKWRFPAIQVSPDDEPERRMQRGVESLLELDVEPHQLLDAVNVSGESAMMELFIHAGADDREVEPAEDTEVKWVDPGKLDEYLEDTEMDKMERRELSKFVRKLESMPGGDKL